MWYGSLYSLWLCSSISKDTQVCLFVTGTSKYNWKYDQHSWTGWESLHKRRKDSKLISLFKSLKGRASIQCDDLHPQICAIGISIKWHFKCHMLELTFTTRTLGIGMHALHLWYPLLKFLRTLSLDSHHLWDLQTSLRNRWPWWMNVSWCATSKIFWLWSWCQ